MSCKSSVVLNLSLKCQKSFQFNTKLLLQVNNLPQQLEKMNELNHLPGFRHDANLIEETGKFDHSKKEKKRGFPLFNILLNNE